MRHIVLASFALFALTGCGASTDSQQTPGLAAEDRGGGGEMTTTTPGGGGGTAIDTSGGGGTGVPASEGGGTSGTGGGAGLLTAGTWDDNQNYDFYLAFTKTEDPATPGSLKIPRADRLRVAVSDGAGAPLGGARVVVKAGDTTIFDGPSGTDGNVDVYPTWSSVAAGTALSIAASDGASTGSSAAKAGDSTATVSLAGSTAAATNALDVALVIDTTGSMGDEINYLRSEVAAIVGSVATKWPTASQRWATVAYKDIGDEYVVKAGPFESDVAKIQASINALSAGGGGDYPESPDQALAAASALDWRGKNTARVVFWIADAPHHAGKEATMISAIQAFRSKGVHVYPIAASGADPLTELTMRTTAQLTLGRYLFLTDDSGIGGAHLEPKIPCYFVTKLDRAMLRMIATELGGTYLAPAKEDILRIGGDPKEGACTLADGQQVKIY
ncbi:MAG: vWA domain-containing protein [Polyangiales bacterium]